MSIATQEIRRKMTKEEFYQLPEGPPDYEFEDGEVILLPRPHERHQGIIGAFIEVLQPYIRTRRLGRIRIEIDVDLTETRAYVPDIVYVSTEHLDRLGADGRIHGAPDLAVEISSRSSVSRDRIRKFEAYAQAGVSWYWLVDQDTLTIEEYHLRQEGYVRTASVDEGEVFRPGLFPGLEIDLRELVGEEEMRAEGT
jgi:Uma2 family endonuclease